MYTGAAITGGTRPPQHFGWGDAKVNVPPLIAHLVKFLGHIFHFDKLDYCISVVTYIIPKCLYYIYVPHSHWQSPSSSCYGSVVALSILFTYLVLVSLLVLLCADFYSGVIQCFAAIVNHLIPFEFYIC